MNSLSALFETEVNHADYICEYFDEKLMDSSNWTFPVTDKGIDGVEIVDVEIVDGEIVVDVDLFLLLSHPMIEGLEPV